MLCGFWYRDVGMIQLFITLPSRPSWPETDSAISEAQNKMEEIRTQTYANIVRITARAERGQYV